MSFRQTHRGWTALAVLLGVLASGRVAEAQSTEDAGSPGDADTIVEAPVVHSQRARAMLRDSSQFPFCTDSKRLVRPAELEYCGYLDKRSACPEFLDACERLSRQPPACNFRGGNFTFAGRTIAFFVALALLILVFGGLRSWYSARELQRLVTTPKVFPEETLEPTQELSAAEWYARALEALQRGESSTALYALHRAALLKLAELGQLRLDASRTHGDYLRQLEQAPSRALMRELFRRVEDVRFGGLTLPIDVVRALGTQVESLVRALPLLLLACSLTLSMGACNVGQPVDLSGRAGSSATGLQLYQKLLELQGLELHRVRGVPSRDELALNDETREPPLLVLQSAQGEIEPREWKALFAHVRQGARLLIFGANALPPELGLERTEYVGQEDVEFEVPVRGQVRVPTGAASFAVSSGDEKTVLARYDSGSAFAVQLRLGGGTVVVLATGAPVTNGGLALEHNADVMVALAEGLAGTGRVYFLEGLDFVPNNPLLSFQRVGLLPSILQGMLSLSLFFLVVGRHFAKAREPVESTRRTFAEHVRAVGELFRRAGRGKVALVPMAQWFLERLREQSTLLRLEPAVLLARLTAQPSDHLVGQLADLERFLADGSHSGRRTELEALRWLALVDSWSRALSGSTKRFSPGGSGLGRRE